MSDINDDERQDMMQRDVLLVATAAASLLNGQAFSPFLTMAAILLKPFVAGTLLASPVVFLYLTSLFVSLLTLMLAGIPAAIYERINGQQTSSPTSLGIWFGATLALTVPTFMAMGQPGV